MKKKTSKARVSVIGVILLIIGVLGVLGVELTAARQLGPLTQARSQVTTISPDFIDPSLEDKLVATTGRATTVQGVTDAELDLTVSGFVLERIVETRQWEEVIETSEVSTSAGGEARELVRYNPVWSQDLIDHTVFRFSGEHRNPLESLIEQRSLYAPGVTAGKFILAEDLVATIPPSNDFVFPEDYIPPRGLDLTVEAGGRYLFKGKNYDIPQVGDTRISYRYTPEGTLSIIGRQQGESLFPYVEPRSGNKIALALPGEFSAKELVALGAEKSDFARQVWWWRLGYLLILVLAYRFLLYRPNKRRRTTKMQALFSVLSKKSLLLGVLVATVITAAGLAALMWLRSCPLYGGITLGVIVILKLALWHHRVKK